MNILVCIKAVPASTSVNLDPETNTMIRSGIKNVINPFDAYALDLALNLKEKYGANIDILSMGVPSIKYILRHTYSLGVDKASLLTDKMFAGADTLATSYSLAKTIEALGTFDLIFCGKQSTDGDTAQVGPEIAELLELPHLTHITSLELSENKSKLIVNRKTSKKMQRILISLPAVLTIVKGDNVPKMATLKKYLDTLDKKVELLTRKDINVDESRIGLKGSPTQVVDVFTPRNSDKKKILKASTKEQAKMLLKILNLARK